MFNWEQVKGIVERVATIAITYAVARDWIPAGQSADLVALAVLAASILWGWKVNTQPALIEAAASMPKVEKVVVDDQQLAQSLTKPGAKVTAGR